MKWLSGILVLAMMAVASGCGGGASSSTSTSVQQESGSVFVNGTDAPLPSVVSFQVDITGMTVSDGTNPPVSVLNGTQTIDFARLNGLHTLLDINSIPAGVSERDESADDSSNAADGHDAQCNDVASGHADAVLREYQPQQSVDGERGRYHWLVF